MKKETVKMRFWGLVIVPLMIIVFKNVFLNHEFAIYFSKFALIHSV